MKRLDLYVIGYRVYSVSKKDVKTLCDIFLHSDINVKVEDGKFALPLTKCRKIEEIVGNRVKLTRSEIKGLTGFFVKHRKRYGIIAALVLGASFFALTTGRIWDVRIDGEDVAEVEELKEELSSVGFSAGKLWRKIDTSKTEAELLSVSDVASWININRRGNVAYVSFIRKSLPPQAEEKSGYSNIVAASDAVIESITVNKGYAVVKVGDVVKKGQLLISGLTAMENGEYCYAEGTVIGRTDDEILIEVSEKSEESRRIDEKITKLEVEFLNFELNILNRGRNSGIDCDIIKKEKRFSLFGKDIPIVLRSEYMPRFETVERKLTSDEMTEKARNLLCEKLFDRLSYATLCKIKTQGRFNEDGYVMSTKIILSESIGENQPFRVEE